VHILWDYSPKGLFSQGSDPEEDGKVEIRRDWYYRSEEAIRGTVLNSALCSDIFKSANYSIINSFIQYYSINSIIQ
jgi:hypothetical protein